MALPQTRSAFDIDAYLAWEETQEERHEYLAGEVFAMSGGSDTHFTILGNLFATLRGAFSGKPCRPFVSGMKVRVSAADTVFYPDVFVTCDERDRAPEGRLAKEHPVFVAEVLSASTAAFDRGRKFEIYQRIPALREYLLIEQDRPHADLFRKNDEGLWVLHPVAPGGTVELRSLSLTLPLAVLYEDVEFPEEPPLPWPMPSPGSAPG
ncbi:MAG: Uma2 family endonuclease [Azonexus sp.]|jgi:Uma2 family endonuclease